MTLMLVAYFPAFHMLAQTLNPALAEAEARTPVVVVANPSDCSFQFDPVVGQLRHLLRHRQERPGKCRCFLRKSSRPQGQQRW